jgi:hypothetical protein
MRILPNPDVTLIKVTPTGSYTSSLDYRINPETSLYSLSVKWPAMRVHALLIKDWFYDTESGFYKRKVQRVNKLKNLSHTTMKDHLTKPDLNAIKREYNRLRDAYWKRNRTNPWGYDDHQRLALKAMKWFIETYNEGYGVEYIERCRDNQINYYVNMGETYATTVIAHCSHSRVTFKLGSWGDLVESGEYR